MGVVILLAGFLIVSIVLRLVTMRFGHHKLGLLPIFWLRVYDRPVLKAMRALTFSCLGVIFTLLLLRYFEL